MVRVYTCDNCGKPIIVTRMGRPLLTVESYHKPADLNPVLLHFCNLECLAMWSAIRLRVRKEVHHDAP